MPLAANQPGILLPAFPDPVPLPEVVLFAFDRRAFPFQQQVECRLIAGQQPRLVLRHGEEGSHEEVLLYGGSVVRIGDLYHMWYNGNYGPPANEIGFEHTNCCICYAYSHDGLTWERPDLGLVDFNGSKQNNIVYLPAPTLWSSAAVLYDSADNDAQRRFKMAYQAWYGGELLFCTAVSSDGLQWQPSERNPVGPAFQVSGLVRHGNLYYACGQTAGSSRLATLASADFEHWSPCAAPGFDRSAAGEEEGVHLGAGLWNRGNVILGVYGQWHGHPTGDRRLTSIDLGLAISHDAVRFHEPVPGFRLIPAAEQPHSPVGVAPALLQGQGMDNFGDDTLCWYSLWRAMRGNGVRLVSWTRDRLGMLEPGQDAMVITTPFEVVVGKGRVAFNVSGLGGHTYLRVNVLDEGFHPIPRYSGPDAALITDNGLRVPAHWNGGNILHPTHGLMRLAIHFAGLRPEDARLYAVYIGE